MKVLELSRQGIKQALPAAAEHPTRGRYYVYRHGREGRGRKMVSIPLAVAEYPVRQDGKADHLTGANFTLVYVGDSLLLKRGDNDGRELVLWWLDPGFRGSAFYLVEGHATVLAEGREAQGAAGRMGGAPCPVVLVTGDCVLRWERTGRLYGSEPLWRAIRKDGRWTVEPDSSESDAIAAATNPATD